MEKKVQVSIRHYRPRKGAYLPTCYSKGNGFLRPGWACGEFRGFDKVEPDPKGGRTAAFVTIDGIDYWGGARCSLQDSFCYKLGRTIALGRLRKKLEQAGLLDMVEWPK